MSELEKTFNTLHNKKEKALIPFFTCGYPGAGLFKDLIKIAADSGADILEIGIPFSDPLADGPSIQFSSNIALKNRVNVQKSLGIIASIKKRVDLPLVILTYANPIFQYGLDKFTQDATAVGISGVIMADLVVEESKPMEKLFGRQGLDLIHLAAPTTNGSRLIAIARRSQGFIYLVSVTGVTGARRDIPAEVSAKIRDIKRLTNKPVCVGFGISKPIQAKRIAQECEGIIVGSALVDLIRKSRNKSELLKKASRFLQSLKKAMEE